MKIEKINDRQLRCVLTKADLEDRKIRLSELVCGGEKARGLFRDMMIQATRELGFSFNNNPLMIEALPSGKDQLVLIITRVDDPGELDSKFKHFSGTGDMDKKDRNELAPPVFTGADDILNLLKHFAKKVEEKRSERETSAAAENADAPDGKDAGGGNRDTKGSLGSGMKEQSGKNASSRPSNTSGANKKTAPAAMRPLTEEEIYQYTRFYLFHNLENVLSAASRIGPEYQGMNSLYKNPDDGAFYLLVRKMDTNPELFNRICNVLSEYSMPMDYASGMEEFFREHMQVIIADRALQYLRCV